MLTDLKGTGKRLRHFASYTLGPQRVGTRQQQNKFITAQTCDGIVLTHGGQ